MLGCLAALALGGCGLLGGEGKSGSATAAPQAIGGGKPAPTVAKGPLSDAADALLETDRAFAAKSLEAGTAPAFSQFLDEQGIQLPVNGEPVLGRKAITDGIAAWPPSILSWEPRYAEVFAPGNWGWTWGTWQLHEPGAGGRRLAQGKYLNIWKRQSDGGWKLRTDMQGISP